MWKPDVQRLDTLIRVQHRVTADINGSPDISYVNDPDTCYCSWKGKGGTESIQNGTLMVLDTAEVVMWYRPDITEQTRILLHDEADQAFEVLNVEDVGQRHMWLIVKVQRAVNA